MTEAMDYEVIGDLAVNSLGSAHASRSLPCGAVARLRGGGNLAPDETTPTLTFEDFLARRFPPTPPTGEER